MVYYELVKIIIDTLGLAEMIMNIIMCYYRVLELIVIDWGLLFTSKFWSLLCYFFKIKKSYLQPFTLK